MYIYSLLPPILSLLPREKERRGYGKGGEGGLNQVQGFLRFHRGLGGESGGGGKGIFCPRLGGGVGEGRGGGEGGEVGREWGNGVRIMNKIMIKIIMTITTTITMTIIIIIIANNNNCK